jgi:MFS family permease
VLITASGLAYFIGWTILYPVLPRFVREELGGNGLAVGLSVGAFGLTAALLRPLAGKLGDERGRRLLVVLGMAIVCVSLLGYLLVNSVAGAVALRLVFGAGEAFAFVGLATAIQDMAPPDRRGEAASYFSVATYGGVAVGPPLGQFIYERGGFTPVWWVAAATVAVGLVLGLAVPSGAPAAPAAPRADEKRRAFIHPAAVRPGFAVAAALVGYSGFVSFGALYADNLGLSSPGLVFTAYAVLIVGFRVGLARLPDRYGAVSVSAFSVIALAAGLLVMAATGTAAGLFAGVVLFALGMALNFPALLALVVNQAEPADRTYAVASLSVFFDIGFGLGGPIVGAVVALSTIRWGFVAGAAVTLSSLLALRTVERATMAPTPSPQPAAPVDRAE